LFTGESLTLNGKCAPLTFQSHEKQKDRESQTAYSLSLLPERLLPYYEEAFPVGALPEQKLSRGASPDGTET
jgi:hypothetical protein